MDKNRKIYITAIIAFFILNIQNVYFISTQPLNRYLVPFNRTFLGEFNAIIGNVSIVFLLFSIIYCIFKKRKSHLIGLFVVTIILNIAVYALGIFVKYYGQAFSFESLTLFKNPGVALGLTILWEAVKDLIVEVRIIVFLPAALMAIPLFMYDKNNTETRKIGSVQLMNGLSMFLALTLLMIANLSLFSPLSKKWNSNVARSTYVTQNLGTYPYYVYQLFGENFKEDYTSSATTQLYNTNQSTYKNIIDAKNYSNILDGNQLSSQVELDQTLKDYLDENGYLNGVFKDKNLVIVHLESFNYFLYNEYKESWPNLNKILKESYVLDNFYNNVGVGTSADAEFAILTGLYPTGDTTIYWDYSDNAFDVESIPRLFKRQGYYTEGIHAEIPEFYNRGVVYPELFEFDKYYMIDDFIYDHYLKLNPDQAEITLNDKEKDIYRKDLNETYNHENPWVTDYAVFDRLNEQMDTLSKEEKSYFLYPVTMMPHTPFLYDPINNLENTKDTDDLNSLAKKYVDYIDYYDSLFEHMFKSNDHINDDVVYFFYGDHGANLQKNDIAKIIGDPDLSDMGAINQNLQTMAFIYAPGNDDLNQDGINEGLIKGNQTLVRSQIDFFRTIVELYGIKTTQPYFGVNLLSKEPTFSINNRYFSVVMNTRNGGFSSFLMGNEKYAYGDYSNVDSITKDYIWEKKQVISSYIRKHTNYETSR